MSKTIFVASMILLSVLSNGSFARYEVMIENKSNSECIYVRVFPVGAVFNGDKQYSLQCKFPTNDYQYIIGCSVILTPFGTPRSTIEINHDADGTTGGTKAAIGFGKYMVKFYQVTIQGQDTIVSVQSFDSCEIDYSDSDFPNYLPFPGGITLDRDIAFKYYNQDSITYNWNENLIPNSRLIQIWDQRARNIILYKPQNKNGFTSINMFDINYARYPIDAADEMFGGAHLHPEQVYVNITIKTSNIRIKNDYCFVLNGSIMEIPDSFNFIVGNDSKLILNGNSHLRAYNNSEPKLLSLGNNSSIELEGGNVNLNNTMFELASGASSWKGITLTNTGLDTIKNCTFSGADTIIRIYNSNKCFARNKKIITGSRFNNGIVRLSNVFRALISNDTFATNNSSHYLLTVSNSVHPNDENIYCDEEESPSPMFNLNIVGNVFTGGSVQLYLNCLASDFTPFYVFGNTFSGNTNTTGIVCNKVSGDIKYNIVGGTASLSNVILLQSNVNFFGNVFSSGYSVNVGLNSSSAGTFSPFTSMGNDYWIGGLNVISSEDDNNIYYTGASDISMKNGRNCLSIANLYKYHLRGILTGKCDTGALDATYNHWSVEPPVHLITCNSISKALNYFPSAGGCGYAIDQSGSKIVDREDGVIDTLMLSVSEESDDEGEESDYVRSLMFKRQGNPDSAKACLENLLEQGTNADFVCRAVEELYLVSELRDTHVVNPQTNSIYSSLKYELENLIQNNPLDSRIVEKAHSVLLMCLTKLKDYSHAISGYDNIIENHPDPVRRMTASWDRAAVLLMMNGTGGGEVGSDKSESTSNSEIKDDPIHRIVTNTFRSLESEEKMTMTKEQMTLHRIHETRRLKFRPADKGALESRISEDLELIIGSKEMTIQEKESSLNSDLIVHPNYPNPFNPVTTVIYELPEPSRVYAKVYDNTGREVEVLFSGFKQKGRHTLTFNGSRLSSGVYYLKVGNAKTFVMRKLILIK